MQDGRVLVVPIRPYMFLGSTDSADSTGSADSARTSPTPMSMESGYEGEAEEDDRTSVTSTAEVTQAKGTSYTGDFTGDSSDCMEVSSTHKSRHTTSSRSSQSHWGASRDSYENNTKRSSSNIPGSSQNAEKQKGKKQKGTSETSARMCKRIPVCASSATTCPRPKKTITNHNTSIRKTSSDATVIEQTIHIVNKMRR